MALIVNSNMMIDAIASTTSMDAGLRAA